MISNSLDYEVMVSSLKYKNNLAFQGLGMCKDVLEQRYNDEDQKLCASGKCNVLALQNAPADLHSEHYFVMFNEVVD